MASQIDPTVIHDNQPVDKNELRDQFETAAQEITALQLATSLARKMAYSNSFFYSL